MKARLSGLYFLQFAVWGCYLTCFGQLLGAGGLGSQIQWFYAAVGMVSLFVPALLGYVGDRFIAPGRLLGFCHLGAAVMMLLAWRYASSHPQLGFAEFLILYLGFLLFYMPTMALANTTAFALLKSRGEEPVESFPSIRMWGTIGFVAGMWLVNCTYFHDGALGFTLTDGEAVSRFRFQYTPMQLLASSLFGFVTAAYTLTLPLFRGSGMPHRGNIYGSKALSLFRDRGIRTFLIFAVFAGVCLQISNGFAIPYINHFMGISGYAGSFASGNATFLFSLSQISEAACVLLVGVVMTRAGFRHTVFIALAAWSLRFLFLGTGNPGNGLWMLVLSMIIYGVSFNFFTIAGQLYIEQRCPAGMKGLGQGLLMTMSSGIGATLGMMGAGGVVNSFCRWQPVETASGAYMRLCMGDWTAVWLIFAAYALVLALLFLLFFRRDRQR